MGHNDTRDVTASAIARDLMGVVTGDDNSTLSPLSIGWINLELEGAKGTMEMEVGHQRLTQP